MLPRSLNGRLVVAVVGLVALVGVLVSLATTIAMRHYLVGRLDDDVRGGVGRSFAVFYGPPDQSPDGNTFHRRAIPGGGEGALSALFANTSDGVTAASDGSYQQLSTTAMKALAKVPADNNVHEVSLPGVGSYRVVAETLEITGQPTLVSGLPTKPIDDAVSRLLWWGLLMTICGVAAAALAGDLLVRRTLRPLRQVAETATEVTRLPLDSGSVGETVRVPDELADPRSEVGRVGAALNRMLGHVEGALDARHRSELQVRQFVADASHELRTPLATIKGYAELARRSPAYDATQALSKVESEADRMSALVDDLLLLARLDAGRPLAEEPVDLTRVILEAVADARVVSPEHRWTLDLDSDPVTVTGDGVRLHQVLSNLLSNARRHTPAGTTVTVGLHENDGHAVLTVHDDGPGLPEELQDKAFERFSRGDGSRTRDSGGVGLGLSLVDAISAAHDGSVEVSSAPGATTFTVVLPAHGSPDPH